MKKGIFKKICLLACFLFLDSGAAVAQDAQRSKPAVSKAKGALTWVKTFGSPNLDMGYSVKQTSDGGYAVVGYTFQFSRQRPQRTNSISFLPGGRIGEFAFCPGLRRGVSPAG